MLPSSHVAPINKLGPEALQSPQLLADAFSEFISASSLLEASYRDLQQEVAHLGLELAERNAALSSSLAENDRMRAALQQMIDSMPCGVLVVDTAEAIVMINPESRRLLELGSRRVRSLRDLAAISQVDFESLMDGSADHLDTEVCIPCCGRSALAGDRQPKIIERIRRPRTGKQARRAAKVSGFSAILRRTSRPSRNAKPREAPWRWRRLQPSWPTKLETH